MTTDALTPKEFMMLFVEEVKEFCPAMLTPCVLDGIVAELIKLDTVTWKAAINAVSVFFILLQVEVRIADYIMFPSAFTRDALVRAIQQAVASGVPRKLIDYYLTSYGISLDGS